MRPFYSLIAVLMLATATLPSRALALVITTCGVTCTSDCELGSNIVCADSQNGVVLSNGADLNLRGFDIGCEYDSRDPVNSPDLGSCGVAVRMTGAGSRVFSSSSLDSADPTPRIRGVWTNAIECQAMASSEVSGITIELAGWGKAVERCAIVERNSIWGRPLFEGVVAFDGVHFLFGYPNVGVHIGGVTLRVSDNVVDGFEYPITRLGTGGTQPLLVENNVVNHRDYYHPFPSAGFDLTGSSRPGTIRENVVVGDGIRYPIKYGPGGGFTFDANTCRTGHLECNNCLATGLCDASSFCTSP